MKLLATFILHEWQVQSRSVRSRFVVGIHFAVATAPSLAVHLGSTLPMGGQHAIALGSILPAITFAAAVALSLDGLTRERDEGSLQVLGLGPVSNAGYVLRRWLALALPLAAISAAPVVASYAIAGSGPGTDPTAGAFMWPWLLRAVPAAFLGSALGLGFGTIAGGPILAILQAFLFGALALSLGNDLLARTGRVMAGPGDWLGLELAVNLGTGRRQLLAHPGWASDAPLDVLAEAQASLAQVTFLAALSIGALALAVAYLRRTQPDARPMNVPEDHPFRGFLGWLNRLRPSALPDPGLGRLDAAAMTGLLAVVLAILLGAIQRQDRYRALGSERSRAERAGLPEPTSRDLVASSWSVAGRLVPDGRWTGTFDAGLRNEGRAPIDRIACSLDPALNVEDARVDGAPVAMTRTWDRIELLLATPIGPGAAARLTGRVAGRPVTHHFELQRRANDFVTYWAALESGALANELVDLSRSSTLRKASPRMVALGAADLAPVPRYESWQLRQFGIGRSARHLVPDDEAAGLVDVSLDLVSGDGILLASSCGGLSRADDAGALRLRSSCRLALHDVTVRGGRLVAIPGVPPSLAGFAVLPGHVEAAQRHVPALARGAEEAASAWPGLEVPATVVLEDITPPRWQDGYSADAAQVEASMLLISEHRLLEPREIAVGGVTARAATAALLARRPVESSEQLFFRHFFGAVVRSRLGTGPGDAVMSGDTGLPAFRYATAPLTAQAWDGTAWGKRLPAAIHALRMLAGDEPLREAVDAFTRREGTGTARELFELIEQLTPAPALAFHDDFIAGDAVPILTLEDVVFERAGSAGDAWRVRGHVRNRGGGRVRCPLVVRTDSDPVTASVEVGPDEAAAFTLTSSVRPRLLLMDPRGDCLRYRPLKGVGIIERVEADGKR